jgi:hypothetical protein
MAGSACASRWIFVLAGAVAAALTGCKTDDARPARGSAAPASPAAPATPAPSAVAGPPTFPTLAAATPLGEARATPDGDTRLVSWCIDAPDAQAAAMTLVEALQGDWEYVTKRGSGTRIGVSGSKQDHRLSIVVGGTDQRCKGIFATATIVRAGAFVPPPPLEDGEKIH